MILPKYCRTFSFLPVMTCCFLSGALQDDHLRRATPGPKAAAAYDLWEKGVSVGHAR